MILLLLVDIDGHELFLNVLMSAALAGEALRRGDLARILFYFILAMVTGCQVIRLVIATQRCRQRTVVLHRDRVKVILGHLARV